MNELNIHIRHDHDDRREKSTCGYRQRLLSHEDDGTAAWAHVVEIDGSKPHYHKRATEIYYILEGEGTVTLDGHSHAVRPGSILHIPPGVVHSASGRTKVLVIGIPDIRDDDVFFPDEVAS